MATRTHTNGVFTPRSRRSDWHAALLGLVAVVSTAVALAAASSDPPDDEEPLNEAVIVTGMAVRQGGAQDINFFRGEAAAARIPHPNALTAEGLFGEHDLTLPARARCAQLFCLTSEAVRADLLTMPEARYLVALGFSSNIDPRRWRRERLNLVAVVDKSGSMDGPPLALVRASLKEIVQQLRLGDQLSIVLYGDTSHVHLPPTPVTPLNRAEVLAQIEAIESAGSTSMEAGLRLGYDTAFATQARFAGTTRLMLFTDERPNVGATDAESFMGMAQAASARKIGLTTIGVGVQFGAELATRIASVRGGNLFFIRDLADVRSVYAKQLDYMMSELAHDLEIRLQPPPGYKMAAIFGVPGELLQWQDEAAVTVKIPTVFLDRKGGGIFVALAPDAPYLPSRAPPTSAALLEASVTYRPHQTRGPARPIEQHAVRAEIPAGTASAAMTLGHLLVDEFTVLRAATSAHYLKNDQTTAYRLVRDFRARLASAALGSLEGERKLFDDLEQRFAHLSGHRSEVAQASATSQLWGEWRVTRAAENFLIPGTTLVFRADGAFAWFKPGDYDARAARAPSGFVTGEADDESEDDTETVVGFDDEEYRATDRKLLIESLDFAGRYAIDGATLTLESDAAGQSATLTRVDRLAATPAPP